MTEETNTKDLVVFLDTIGRTIIAERTGETEAELNVENPAVVNIVPQQAVDPATGQPTQRMALQLFPLFFREFLAAKDEPVRFTYKKDNITMSDGDIRLDFKVGIQYEQLFAVVGEINETPETPAPAPATDKAVATQETTNGDNVIQLFEDEDQASDKE